MSSIAPGEISPEIVFSPDTEQEVSPPEHEILRDLVNQTHILFSECEDFFASIEGENKYGALKKILKVLNETSLLTVDFYTNVLKKHPVMKEYVTHDLSNITGILFAEMQGVLGKNVQKHDQIEILEYAKNFIFYYLRSVEDIFLRCIDEPRHLPAPQLFEYSYIKQSADFDYSVAERRDTQKRGPKFVVEDLAEQALSDRAPFGYGGVVDNFVLNVLRNAFRPSIGAKEVRLRMAVDENTNELVYTIQDNGSGIPEQVGGVEFFKKGESGQIGLFQKGKSGSKSTGLGLSDADKRFPLLGMKLAVVTKRADGSTAEWSSVNDEASSHFDLGEHGTVFEVRVPLKTKSLLEQQSTPGLVAA